MKSLLTCLFLLIIYLNCHSQYSKTLTDGSIWNQYYLFEIDFNEEYFISGYSVINNKEYKIISGISPYDTSTHLLREDTVTKRIFEYYNGSEILMYDYSLQVGDTFWLPNNTSLNIDFIILDSITNNLLYLPDHPFPEHLTISITEPKVFYLSDPYFHAPFVWIEGIGSVKGLTTQWNYDSYLICHTSSLGDIDFHCNIDSSCYAPEWYSIDPFYAENEYNIYPNPVVCNLTIEGLNGKERVSVRDLLGRHVRINTINESLNILDFSQQPKGIYLLLIEKEEEVKVFKILK